MSHIRVWWVCFRNPSLSDDRRWTDTYWPLHTPLKRETLVLNSDSSQVLEGHRVKKCAFWRKFLPLLRTYRRLDLLRGRTELDISCNGLNNHFDTFILGLDQFQTRPRSVWWVLKLYWMFFASILSLSLFYSSISLCMNITFLKQYF